MFLYTNWQQFSYSLGCCSANNVTSGTSQFLVNFSASGHQAQLTFHALQIMERIGTDGLALQPTFIVCAQD
jgi:hypothetical protein